MLISAKLSYIAVRPDYSSIIYRIAKMTGRSSREVMGDNLNIRDHLFWKSVVGSSDTMLVGVWAKRVVDGHITIEDIFLNTHSFDDQEVFGNQQLLLAYHLLGIPTYEWSAWRTTHMIGRSPHYIRRVLDIGKSYGYDIQPLDVNQLYDNIMKSTLGQRNRANKIIRLPSIDVVTSYVKFLAKIQRLGFDPRTLQNTSEWWSEDWSPEAVVRFCNLGVTIDQVKAFEAQGVTGSEIMIRILFDGFPLEWAIAASKAKDE